MSFVKTNPNPNPLPPTQGPADPYGPQDPYLEDWGLDDPYGENFGFGEGEGDMYVEGEDPFGDGEGGAPAGLDVKGAREKLTALETLLKDNEELSAEKKEALTKQLDALRNKINQAAALQGEALQLNLSDIFSEFTVIETQITGVNPETGEEDPTVALSNQVEQTLEAVKNNENLSDKDKDEFTEKLDKILVALETPGLGDVDNLQEQFDQIKEEFNERAMHPSSIMDLADFTGLDAESLDKLFDKHGIDPKHLPNPPDNRIAAMLNDPEFGGNIASLVKNSAEKYDELKEFIKTNADSARATNDSNLASDTSVKDNVNWTVFKNLLDAKNHEDDASKNLNQARTDAATEVAKILGALYGKEVTAIEEDGKAGMILFNGTELNILSDGGNEKVAFSNSGPDWPDVDLVPVYVDNGGGGKTEEPSWARQAHYPYHIYDDKGTCSDGGTGRWDW
jgi:hypothetical protein